MNAPLSIDTGWPSGQPEGWKPEPPDTDDLWAWWFAALDDRFGLFDVTKPQTGFYRCRPRMRERGQPICIWWDPEAEEWFAQLDRGPFVDIGWAWLHSHKFPITQELHDKIAAGGAWPDEVPAPVPMAGIGHNSASDEEIALDAIQQLDTAFVAFLTGIGGKIETEEQDQTAEGYKKRMAELRDDIAQRHKAVRQPDLEAKAEAVALKDAADARLKLIDAQWKGERGPLTRCDQAAARIAEPLSAYRTARAELRKAAAAAAREARAAVAPALYSADSNEKAATRQPSNVVTKPKGGRTAFRVEFTDRRAFIDQLLGMDPPPEDLIDVLTKIARRMLDAKAQVHGAKLTEYVKV